MDKVVWGIIGCGDVAEVKSGPAFQKAQNSELLAVMRRDPAKAQDFALRHEVPHWYDNVEELLEDTNINAVYIATPPSSHLEISLKAIAAGKNIYLEKPMTLNQDEAEEILRALKSSNSKLTVAHYRRKLPAFLMVRELLEESQLKIYVLPMYRSYNPPNPKSLQRPGRTGGLILKFPAEDIFTTWRPINWT